ncbi:transmembrane protein 115-like [Oscarella lobularis]|uniref:transmembrane protein 115-like n=1 Tax=Oscarella lobularis TaxID=121494 RepID=UPI0033140530
MSQKAANFVSLIQSTALQAIGRASLAVRGISVALLVFYALSFIPGFANAMSVNPGTSYPPHFRIWSFTAAGFLETHWWNVLVDIIVTIMAAQMLEPLWTSREFLKFIMIANAGASVLTALFFVVLYIVTRSDRLLFSSFHGYLGVVAGFLVACKQAMPDYLLGTASLIKIKIQLLPLLFFLVFVAFAMCGLTSLASPSLIGSGVWVSWIYLRFYQPHKGVKGDLSDPFAFATFFPEQMQPCVQVIANPVYNALIALKLCPKRVRTVNVDSLSSVTISLPGMDKADADRRRQKALKALDERLSKAEPQASWPSMSDDGDATAATAASATTTTTTPSIANQSNDALPPTTTDTQTATTVVAAASSPPFQSEESNQVIDSPSNE